MQSIHQNIFGKEYLIKANEINPNDARIFDAMMVHYETIQEELEFNRYANKMFQYNVLPASILNWGHNILSELDENAILFTQGDNDFKIQRVIQELSDLAAGKRNDLFGASLTPQELLESKSLFYDRNSANFLPQALSFIDRIFSKDKFQYYEDRYDIDKMLLNKVQEARDTWSSMRNSFKGWEAPSSAKEKLSRSGLKSTAPAAGGTNAPAAGKTTSGKGFKIISE
jgi:hypothetical protein